MCGRGGAEGRGGKGREAEEKVASTSGTRSEEGGGSETSKGTHTHTPSLYIPYTGLSRSHVDGRISKVRKVGRQIFFLFSSREVESERASDSYRHPSCLFHPHTMHFLIGWPATLKLPLLPPLPTDTRTSSSTTSSLTASTPPLSDSSADPARHPLSIHTHPAFKLNETITEPIRNFAQNERRTRTAVVTDTAVYLFQFEQVSRISKSSEDRVRELFNV